jgi:hypothetical protein
MLTPSCVAAVDARGSVRSTQQVSAAAVPALAAFTILP